MRVARLAGKVASYCEFRAPAHGGGVAPFAEHPVSSAIHHSESFVCFPTAEDAFEVAANNLAKAFQAEEFQLGGATLIDGTNIGMARGNWMAPAGALMLGNFYEMLKENLGGEEFAAVAVNQQCLFAFPTDEKTLGSKSLRIAIEDEFRGHACSFSSFRQEAKIQCSWRCRGVG